MSVALLLLFQCSTICEIKKTDAVPFLSAKVVRGLWLSKGLCRLVCLENLHTYGLYFPPKPCVSLPRYLYFATKRNQHTPIFGRIKKNVAMDKQKVNTTSSMNRKGYSSSSHYRINPVAEKSEQVLAIKFVQWDVPPLESLCNSKVYLLRAKLNRSEMMSREEKNWLCEAVNSNTYFRTAVPLQGYRFDFFDVLKKYLVNQYGQWTEYYAPDRTSLRAYLYGRINQIVEIPKY